MTTANSQVRHRPTRALGSRLLPVFPCQAEKPLPRAKRGRDPQDGARVTLPGRDFPWKKAGISAQSLRADRILYEVEQTGGDVRRVCDLFGITIDTALHYARTIADPPNTTVDSV